MILFLNIRVCWSVRPARWKVGFSNPSLGIPKSFNIKTVLFDVNNLKTSKKINLKTNHLEPICRSLWIARHNINREFHFRTLGRQKLSTIFMSLFRLWTLSAIRFDNTLKRWIKIYDNFNVHYLFLYLYILWNSEVTTTVFVNP